MACPALEELGASEVARLQVCRSFHCGFFCGGREKPSPSEGGSGEAGDSASAGTSVGSLVASWRVTGVDVAVDGSLALLAACTTKKPLLSKILILDIRTGSLVQSNGIVAHPIQPLFLVCCSNGMTLLFRTDKSSPVAVLHCSNPTLCAAFDSEGLVFACARTPSSVHLLSSDLKDLQEFSTFNLKGKIADSSSIAGLSFSQDGDFLAVCSNCQDLLLLNAFDGTVVARLSEATEATPFSSHIPAPPTFLANSKFVCWTRETAICIFHVPKSAGLKHAQQTLPNSPSQQQVQGLNGGLLAAFIDKHSDAISVLKASPVHALVLTGAGGVVALWQPQEFSREAPKQRPPSLA